MSFFVGSSVNIFGYMITEDIISGIKKGDNKCKTLLYTKLKGRFLDICRVKGVDDVAAHDIIHDAFILIFEKIDGLRDLKLFDHWAKKILFNLITNSYRDLKHWDTKGLLDTYAAGLLLNYDFENELMAADEVALAMQEISKKQATIIKMHHGEEYKCKEIAEILNIPKGTVQSDLLRARRKCYKTLTKYRELANL